MIKSRMWWRIYSLGYSLDKFGDIDKDIARDRHRFGRAEDGGKIDRYGKKYCWIAYYEIAGYRQDKGLLKSEGESEDRKRFTVDIDPSFPAEMQNVEIIKAIFLKSRLRSLPKWITGGPTPDVAPFTILETIQNEAGPWVLINGYIAQEDLDSERDIFIFPRGLLVKKGEVSEIRVYPGFPKGFCFKKRTLMLCSQGAFASMIKSHTSHSLVGEPSVLEAMVSIITAGPQG